MLAKTGKPDLIETVATLLEVAWAFSFAGMLTTSLLETIHEIATHIGHACDALHVKTVVETHISVDGSYNADESWPCIVVSFSDRLVIYKPPGWKVDQEHSCNLSVTTSLIHVIEFYIHVCSLIANRDYSRSAWAF